MEDNKQEVTKETNRELKNPIVFRLETNIGEKDNIIKDYVFEKIGEDIIFFGYFEDNVYKEENGLNISVKSKDVLIDEIKDSLINNGYKKLEDTKDLVYNKPLQTSTSSDEGKGDIVNKIDNIKKEGIVKDNMQAEFKRVKKQEFLKFFRDGLGIITLTCNKINISRGSFYNWYKEDAKFKEAVDGIKSEQHTEVEDRLLNAITDGNIAAIIFYLKSKHPDYRQRLALEGELGLKGDYKRLSDEELQARIKKYTGKNNEE